MISGYLDEVVAEHVSRELVEVSKQFGENEAEVRVLVHERLLEEARASLNPFNAPRRLRSDRVSSTASSSLVRLALIGLDPTC